MYKLIMYRYNDDGKFISALEQMFTDMDSAIKKRDEMKELFENYEIYDKGMLVSTNFKKQNGQVSEAQ